MALTRRHFVQFAATLKHTRPSESASLNELRLWLRIANAIIRDLKSTNPRFDIDRFESACGLIEIEEVISSYENHEVESMHCDHSSDFNPAEEYLIRNG